jgi:hypothetical protein
MGSLALTLAITATAVAGIALSYFLFPWLRMSINNPHNLPHYLTTLFTLALAVFAFYAWRESRRGLGALEGQLTAMLLDERPLLWVIKLSQPQYDQANRRFTWSWGFGNIGKGIAYNVVMQDYLKIGGERYERSRDVKGAVLGVPPPIIVPPIPIPVAFEFHTAASRLGIDKDFFDSMMKTDSGIGLLVRFIYTDASGLHKYSGEICFARLMNGTFSSQNPDEDCPREQ